MSSRASAITAVTSLGSITEATRREWWDGDEIGEEDTGVVRAYPMAVLERARMHSLIHQMISDDRILAAEKISLVWRSPWR